MCFFVDALGTIARYLPGADTRESPLAQDVEAEQVKVTSFNRMSLVCTTWKIAVDQGCYIGRLAVIGPVFWRSVGVGVEEIAVPDEASLLRTVKPLCPRVEPPLGDTRDVLPLSLVVIPEALTLPRLFCVAQEQGVLLRLTDFPPELPEELRDNRLARGTYWGIFTHSILRGSCNLPFDQQEALAKDVGCAVLPTLESLALLVATYIETSRQGSPVHLCKAPVPWNSGRATYMRSSEIVGRPSPQGDRHHMMVGHFIPDVPTTPRFSPGIYVGMAAYCRAHEEYGVGGAVIFPSTHRFQNEKPAGAEEHETA